MALPLSERTIICGLDDVVDQSGHTHILSILDPERAEPEALAAWPLERRLLLRFHDEIDPWPPRLLPSREHIEQILAFGRAIDDGAGGGPSNVLIHCQSGVSRSTAAALMIWAQAAPNRSETDLLDDLARVRPIAWPNSLMVEIADDALGRGWRLVEATRAFFRRRLNDAPALEERMRRLRRGRDIDT